jgi:hypothetical protein
MCGSQSYDGHTGEDSTVRSFQEQRIGVPVFAVLDGRVIEVEDYHRDENTQATAEPVDNHVILDHGGTEVTVYGHLRRRSITVDRGDRVRAGQQIGLTGSSGNSSGPHLHFTIRLNHTPVEPFAGPCREGASLWSSQIAFAREPYVRDATFSPDAFGGRRDPPWDEAVRTGTYLAGQRELHFRVELGNAPANGQVAIRVARPDGSTALVDDSVTLRGYRTALAEWSRALDLDTPGRWTLFLDVDGRRLVEAPFDVVGTPAGIVNRPPAAVAVRLSRTSAAPEGVILCEVQTSLAREDPDYDIVRYRYRWIVSGRVVRTVTSAGLSDVLAAGTARSSDEVVCEVTPSDGSVDGPTATATIRA